MPHSGCGIPVICYNPEYPGTIQLTRFSERKVDAIVAHQRMVAFLERQHPVIAQSVRTTPDNHIPVRQFHSERLIGSIQSAKQESRWDSERYRNNRLAIVLLVFVLMQR